MKKLDRELGLFAVFTIACGAMLSGLFVLPGHAATIGGSSVHLAFLLAGLLFVPAALSKAEMATALPEAGGDYIFIDRAFGPSVSTVTGMGTWLALMLKSAFALVGMSAYLFLIVDLPVAYLKFFSCGVGVFLIVINCIGVKKTGQLQSFLVVATFLVLGVFIERGAVNVHPENFNTMFNDGIIGFLSATAFVFVSYAGVTKVASAAEEIKNPSRNIPWGMLLSLIVMILFYVAVVYIVVGVLPIKELGKSGIYKNAPIAQAAAVFLGRAGEVVISVISVLALTAMANAGLLASSRYPLALSRYDQLPEVFSSVHSKFKTPV
ncbi:MAG: APC family permease, partial [bacterium]